MRILMLSPVYAWPTRSGGDTRIMDVLRGLSSYAQVTYVAPNWDQATNKPDDVEAQIVPVPIPPKSRFHQYSSLVSLKPYHHRLYASAAVQDAVRGLLQQQSFDYIYCHFLYSLQYVPDDSSIPIIVDPQNVDRQYWTDKTAHSTGARHGINWLNTWKVIRYEDSLLPRIWAYACVSERDYEQTKLYAAPKVEHFFVVPNMIDTSSVEPIDWARRDQTNEVTLAFLGSLNMDFNRNAAETLCEIILPNVQAMVPGRHFKLLIIGRDPSPRLMQMGYHNEAITVTGMVADVRPWLRKADIFVAPLAFGAGTKLKTLEAMACGLPVVGSSVAFQGLDAIDHEQCFVANDDAAMVRTIAELAARPGMIAAVGAAGRRLVEEHNDLNRVTWALYTELAARLDERRPCNCGC